MENMSSLADILSAIPSLNHQELSFLDDRDIEEIRMERYNASQGDLNLTDGFNCGCCLNRGWIATVIDGSMALRKCRCMAARQSKRLLRSSGLESLIERCRFERYERRFDWQQAAWNAAREYAAHPEGWLMISGRSGTGKTHLCTAVCREMMLRGIPTRYMLWRDEIGRIKFSDSSDERHQMIRQLQNVQCLYIDDFLKVGRGENPTYADMSLAFEILNHRYNNPGLYTIISTELTAVDILNLDEAVGSRIIERTRGGRCIQFAQSAQNWRLISANEREGA